MKSLAVESLIHDLLAPDLDSVRHANQALIELGGDAVGPLLEALQTASEAGAYRILTTLTKIGDPRAIPGAVRCLQSKSPAVLAVSAQCLSQLGGDAALEALLKVLNEGSTSASMMWILQAIGAIGDSRAVAPLISVVQTTVSPVERYTAIEALGRIGDPRAIETIEKHINDENHHVRSKSLIALEALSVR